MNLLKWSDELSVGISTIDDQHKFLFELVNDLESAVRNQADKVQLTEYIEDLIDYSIYHFDTEEEYADKFNSPYLDYHRQLHNDFATKIVEFKNRYINGDRRTAVDLLAFLKEWLVSHIQYEDKILLARNSD